jgi:hypothetical protein
LEVKSRMKAVIKAKEIGVIEWQERLTEVEITRLPNILIPGRPSKIISKYTKSSTLVDWFKLNVVLSLQNIVDHTQGWLEIQMTKIPFQQAVYTP